MLDIHRETNARPPERAEAEDVERVVETLRAAFERPGLTRDQTLRLAGLAEQAARRIRQNRDETAMSRMRAEIEAQAAFIRRLSDTLVRNREDVSKSLAAGRAGLWECRLGDERVTWTEGVYELFGLPLGATLHRQDTLGGYSKTSLRELETVRSQALRSGGRFGLDAEIESMRGERRWIRISGVVERRDGAATRLYGMKQDVTEERAAADDVRRLAEADALTGLANRRLFEERLAALAAAPDATLLLIDLDGFKQINDTFGHATGDACLKEVAARLTDACRGLTLVARIGGDEFAALAPPGQTRAEIERLAARVVAALRIPVESGGARLELGASVGLARSDAGSATGWMARADAALYQAKAAGRGTFRSFDADVGPGRAPERGSALQRLAG